MLIAPSVSHARIRVGVQLNHTIASLEVPRFFICRESQRPNPKTLRVESARLMMEAGRFSIKEITRKNGFGNRERMRRSFVRAFG